MAQLDDSAATISPQTAKELLDRSTPAGFRLLELFAEHQVVQLDVLKKELARTQAGLNALVGHLTRIFQETQGDPHFYLYLRDLGAWAIGRSSQVSLRRAIREAYEERQSKLFP